MLRFMLLAAVAYFELTAATSWSDASAVEKSIQIDATSDVAFAGIIRVS